MRPEMEEALKKHKEALRTRLIYGDVEQKEAFTPTHWASLLQYAFGREYTTTLTGEQVIGIARQQGGETAASQYQTMVQPEQKYRVNVTQLMSTASQFKGKTALTGKEILGIIRERGGPRAYEYFESRVEPAETYFLNLENLITTSKHAEKQLEIYESYQRAKRAIPHIYRGMPIIDMPSLNIYDVGLLSQGYQLMSGQKIISIAEEKGGVVAGMVFGEQVKPTETYYVKSGELEASAAEYKMLSGQAGYMASTYLKYHPEAGLSERDVAKMFFGQARTISSMAAKYPTVEEPLTTQQLSSWTYRPTWTKPIGYRIYYYEKGVTSEPDIYPSLGIEPSTIPKETWALITKDLPKGAVVYRVETSDMPALDVSQLFKPKGMTGEEIMQTAYREGGIFAAGAFQMQLKPEVRYAITPVEVGKVSREYGSAMEAYTGQLAKWQAEVWKQYKPERQPAQTWGEWLGRAFETKLYFPSPVEQLTITSVIGGEKDTYTQRMISRIEELQHGIKEMPIGQEPTIMFKEGRAIYEKPAERLSESLEPLYLPVGLARSLEGTVGLEPSPTGALFQTLISPVTGGFTTKPITQYWETTKEHPGLLAGQVIGEILLAKYVWTPATEKALAGAKWVGGKVVAGTKVVGEKFVSYTYPKVEPLIKYAVGPERYSYYKSVAYPTFRHVTLPSIPTTIKSAGYAALHQLESIPKQVAPIPYSLLKSVYTPNITQLWKVVGPSISYYKAVYLPQIGMPSFIHVPKAIAQTQLYQLGKTVYLPNITQLAKVLKPTFAYWKEAYAPRISLQSMLPHLGKPEAVSLFKSVYLPNILQPQKVLAPTLSYYMAKAPIPTLPSIGLPSMQTVTRDIGEFIMGKEAYYFYRYAAKPYYQSMITGTAKALKPSTILPEFHLEKPMFYLESKAFTQVIAGKTRFYLHLPTPATAWKPMAPLWKIPEETAKQAARVTTTQVTQLMAKPAIKTTFTIGKVLPTLMAPFALQLTQPKIEEAKEPNLVKYAGPAFPSIYEMKTKWHQVASVKLKAYPTEIFKTEKLAVPVGLLKAWEIERLFQPQRMKQLSLPKQLQMMRQISGQIQIQVQELLPLQVETKKKKELIVPLLKPFAFEVSKQPLKLPQTPQITPQVAEIQMPQLKQIQIQIQEQITLPPLPTFEQFELPRRRKRKPKDLFGEWFKRTHPIKTPREMMFTFGFGSARRRRR